MRVKLLEPKHPTLSMRRQCQLMSVARSSVDYKPVGECEEDIRIKRIMDEVYLIDPCIGTRRVKTLLERHHDLVVNRKRIQRLRREMGLETIFCQPRTTITDEISYKYPYLLRDLEVTAPDEVWCTDITYLPMPHGSAYLCAVMDWHSRKVLGWEVSNTMETGMCLVALDRALQSTGKIPAIFNTDQGSQFTSKEWTERLVGLGIKISMDGKGRWMDNVFIERLWRSLKYEDIYLRGYETIREITKGIGVWFERYNNWRPHQALQNETPDAIYTKRKIINGTKIRCGGNSKIKTI